MPVLIIISVAWLGQFALYFETILKAQINSGYLQSYHHEYFLFATPSNAQEWEHNWMRLKEILNNTVGYNEYCWRTAIFLFLLGFFALLRKSLSLFLLLASPILLTFIAAALNQFSLIERVILFILPFTMLIVGYGFAQFMQFKWHIVQIPVIIFGFFMLHTYNFKSLFYERFLFQELTIAMDYIIGKNGSGKELYVDCASRDTYIYYTQIHPHKNNYASLKGAYLFRWDEDDFLSVAEKIQTPRAFFVFTGGGADSRYKHLDQIRQILNQTDSFELHAHVFTFQKP